MSQPKLFYDDRFADATPVASTTDATADFAVAYLSDWRPYTFWKPTALPATVTVNSGSAKAADYFLIWGHDLFTQGATIELRGSTDNFGASDVLVATKTPTDDEPFLVEFGSVSYQYWRFRITGVTMPTIAIAVAGAALTIPSYLPNGFDPIGREVIGSINTSKEGHPLGKTLDFEKWQTKLTFELLTWTWLRATFLPAWNSHLRSKPFVFAWESTSYGDELRLVVTDKKFDSPHRSGSYCDLTLSVFGVV